jgi:hypothetical protein
MPARLLVQVQPLGWALERGGLGWVVFGTLLGPEGSGASSSSVRASPVACTVCVSFLGGRRRVRVVGFRPYVENYTVDASIFVNQVF